MNPREAIARLNTLLIDEREAIRVIDGTRVEALAMEKTSLLRLFNRELLRGDSELAEGFRSVANELRNNAVILAHARNCLRDVVHAAAPVANTYRPNGRVAATPRRRLSITG